MPALPCPSQRAFAAIWENVRLGKDEMLSTWSLVHSSALTYKMVFDGSLCERSTSSHRRAVSYSYCDQWSIPPADRLPLLQGRVYPADAVPEVCKVNDAR